MEMRFSLRHFAPRREGGQAASLTRLVASLVAVLRHSGEEAAARMWRQSQLCARIHVGTGAAFGGSVSGECAAEGANLCLPIARRFARNKTLHGTGRAGCRSSLCAGARSSGAGDNDATGPPTLGKNQSQ